MQQPDGVVGQASDCFRTGASFGHCRLIFYPSWTHFGRILAGQGVLVRMWRWVSAIVVASGFSVFLFAPSVCWLIPLTCSIDRSIKWIY